MALSKKKKGILFAMFLFFTLLCFIGGLYGGGAAYYKLTNISRITASLTSGKLTATTLTSRSSW